MRCSRNSWGFRGCFSTICQLRYNLKIVLKASKICKIQVFCLSQHTSPKLLPEFLLFNVMFSSGIILDPFQNYFENFTAIRFVLNSVFFYMNLSILLLLLRSVADWFWIPYSDFVSLSRSKISTFYLSSDFIEFISNTATKWKSRLRSRRGRSNPRGVLASLAISLRGFLTVLGVARFPGNHRKKSYWPKICFTSKLLYNSV